MQRILRMPRLATNYVILSGGEFISKVLAAVALAYLARVLGPESYGSLEFAIAIYFVVHLFVDSGLSYIGARELAKDKDKLPRLFVNITLARSILALIAFVFLALLAMFIHLPREVKTLIFLYGLVMLILPWLTQWIFQGQDMMQYFALASLTRWSVFTGLVFLLVHGSQQIWMVPFIEGAAQLSVAVILMAAIIHLFGFPRYKARIMDAFALYRKAIPIGASELVWAIKMYFATILLGFVIGGVELGWFTAAHRIVVALHAFVWLYFYNMLPSISRTSQQPVDALLRLMKNSLQIAAWGGIFIAIFGVLFAEFGITLIFGADYRYASRIFAVLIWLIPLALMSGHFRYTLIGYDKQKYEFYSAVIGVVVNVMLNLLLIGRYGLLGAAVSLVISEAVIWLAAYLYVKRLIVPTPVLVNVWKPLIAGIILSASIYFLMQVNILLAGAIGLVIYLILMAVLQPDLFTNIRLIFRRGGGELDS